MANLSFTTNNQIIRDLYNTAQEALNASKSLGCDGYRTYSINGETKYVPCSSYLLYENALRYRTVQGKIGAFGSDSFGDKLVGLQFANAKNEITGDPFFTLGNFSINKSVPYNQTRDRQAQLTATAQLNLTTQSIQNDAVKSFTVEDIVNRNLPYFEGKPYVETLKNKIDQNIKVNVLFDRRKLDNYVLFSSLKERFKNTLLEIYNAFPAAIKLNAISILTPSVVEYTSYPTESRSEFKVNLYGLSNPFNIEYTLSGSTLTDAENITKYRNFTKTYRDYVVYYNNIEYPIISATFPKNYNDDGTGIRLIIGGDPFSSIINDDSEANVNYYIKPKNSIYTTFYSGLTDLASFLLNIDEESGRYYSEFMFPKISDNGIVSNVKETVFFPKYDDVNVDMFSNDFDKYTTKLNDLADSYDSVKTNLIARFLTTDVLKEFDTTDRKFNLILQLYGKTFDDVKKYIDSITFMRNVSYNKIENVPDLLIKNYARMLGFKTFEIEDENSLIDSLFQLNPDNLAKGTTPAEIDIEIWRRILINSFYLFKSKGTRKSIEFILKLVGLPEEIFEFNEYVYLAERKLDAINTLNKIYSNIAGDDPVILFQTVPFNSDGYPTIPRTVKYQENGGYLREDKVNIGSFDFGKKYINEYKKFNNVYLFDLQRTVDNVKSWVYTEKTKDYLFEDTNGHTEYTSDDSRLSINSKELEVYLASNRIFDVTVYRQYVRNIGRVNTDLNIDSNLMFDASTVSFNQFIKKSLDNFINPKNRKTIKTYPSLSKIYFDYLNTTSTPIDSTRTLEFLNKFDTSWIRLIEQFVPATTIINAGKKIQNSSLLDNKFLYKHGLNDNVSWLGTDGSEFQQAALKPVLLGTTSVTSNAGKINPTTVGEIPTFQIEGKVGSKIYGTDPTINEYLGVHYTMFEYCDTSEGSFYTWESGVDYGDDSIYNGNVNDVLSERYGVFVIYDEKLYRLNTISQFNLTYPPTDGIHTAGIYSQINGRLVPNKAVVVGPYESGYENNLIWDRIPMDVDSRTIVFSDSATSNITESERSFYMNSIGRALAYMNINVDFDCPPPKPHVCYYDITGRTIDLSSYLGTTYKTYVDETGVTLSVKQPKYYGYSKDYTGLKPTGVTYGSSFKWVVPYKKRFSWVDEKVYYKDEIIAQIHSTNKENLQANSKIFLVTGDTVTGTNTYPSSSGSGLKLLGTSMTPGTSGTTINTSTIAGDTPGGMYDRYQDRVKSDPLMHIDPAYISRISLDPNKTVHSINLTKSLNILHIFSGSTAANTFRVGDNIVNGELFISDSISVEFDGFYNLDSTKLGPFYTLNDNSTLIQTLDKSLILQPDTNNYVSIQSLNDNFLSTGNDLTLVKTTPGYYLITRNSFLNFNFNLYFESSTNVLQTVNIKLVNNLGFVYDTQAFTFNGDNIADSREYLYQYNGFFNSGEKISLIINPIDLPCTLSRYETINYEHQEVDEVDYIANGGNLSDPRFRLLFNSGFIGKGYFDDGLSIKPIYNSSDLSPTQLQLKTGTKYSSIPSLDINYSTDPSYIFNTLYNAYYKKYNQNTFIYDTTVYDKELNNDKIDFNFKIRSKNSNIPTSGFIPSAGTSGLSNTVQQRGIETSTLEFDFSYSDYFLGKTPKTTEFNNINNAISIGKKIRKRELTHNRNFSYYPNKSFYNDTVLGTGTTQVTNTFISYDDGLIDYTSINYSGDFMSEIRAKKRYYNGTLGVATFNYYALESEIYGSEIYKAILDKVPLFNSQVINYELNDVVKVPINNYNVVVTTSTGTTIQDKTIYKLYVCVNNITSDNCFKIADSGSFILGEIHPIYHPRGARSCFVDIEKYNPANFTPWGYDESMVNNLPNPNVIDYIYRNTIAYDPTIPQDYKFGDIVIGNFGGANHFFRYIYQKPVIYSSTTTYNAGDFVYSPVTESSTLYYRHYIARQTTLNNNPTAATTGPGYNTYWAKVSSDLFNHRSLHNTSAGMATSGVTFNLGSWLNLSFYLNYSSTAARLPRTLPVTTPGIPLISTGNTVSGITFGGKYNSLLRPDSVYIDNSYAFNDLYEVSSANKILRNIGTSPLTTKYQGTTYGLSVSENGFYETDYYDDYSSALRSGHTNIYLKPGYPANGTYDGYYLYPFIGESNSLLPLFERLTREDQKNNPNTWIVGSSGTTYNPDGLYLGQRYAVNRGVLYKYVGTTFTTLTGSTQPYSDNTNWVENDFCLVNNFTFYKDRTRVSVFESTVESLTTDVKNSLFFFKSNFTLKSGFTNRSFSGSTINNKALTALDKFYDLTDDNRVTPTSHGVVDFRAKGNDIILDYYIEKDPVGYPLTGEFMGKLNIYNPCGNVATTFFGILFDTDVNKLNRSGSISSTPITAREAIDILPYNIRTIITQNGQALANVVVTTKNLDGVTISDSTVVNNKTAFDKNYNIIPNNSVEVSVTYQTTSNQTKFKSAFIDSTPIFINDALIKSGKIETKINRLNDYETRTIILNNVVENATIFVNLKGIESNTLGSLNPKTIFDVKAINIKNSIL